MKKTKVISSKNLPARLPIIKSAVAYLCLDQYNAPDWLWGIVGTLFALLWILAFVVKYYQEEVDVIK